MVPKRVTRQRITPEEKASWLDSVEEWRLSRLRQVSVWPVLPRSQALTTNQSGASNSAGPQLGYAGAGDVDPEIDALADMLGVSEL